MAQRQSKAVTMIILVLSCTQMAVRVKATVLGASDDIPSRSLASSTEATADITAATAAPTAQSLDSTDVAVLKMLNTMTSTLATVAAAPALFVPIPEGVNAVDTPYLFGLLNGTDSKSMELRTAVTQAITEQQQQQQQASTGKGGGDKAASGPPPATISNTFSLEKTARTVQAFINLPVTAGTGANIQLLLVRITEIQALVTRFRSFIPNDQLKAIEKLIVGAIKLYTSFITTFPAAYATFVSRQLLVVRDTFRVVTDSLRLTTVLINAIIVFRTTPPPNPCPASTTTSTGGGTTTTGTIATSGALGTGTTGGGTTGAGTTLNETCPNRAQDRSASGYMAHAMSDSYGEQLISAGSVSLQSLVDRLTKTIDDTLASTDAFTNRNLPDPTQLPGGSEVWSRIANALTNDTELQSNVYLNGSILQETLKQAGLGGSAAGDFCPSNSLLCNLGFGNLDPIPFPAFIDSTPAGLLCGPCMVFTPPNPAITRALQVASAIIIIIANSFNVVQTVAELASDATAVIPAALVLYTGSINYALSVRAYEQLVQDTLPKLRDNAIKRWTNAATNLANNLAASNFGQLRVALLNARTQLLSASPLLAGVTSYVPLRPVSITVQDKS